MKLKWRIPNSERANTPKQCYLTSYSLLTPSFPGAPGTSRGNQIPCCFVQVNIWIIVWAPLWDSAPNLSLFIFEALHGIESSQLPGTSTLYISKATPSDPSFCARCSKHPSWVQGKESQWELWRDHLMMTTSLLRRNFKFVPADTGLPIPSTRFV